MIKLVDLIRDLRSASFNHSGHHTLTGHRWLRAANSFQDHYDEAGRFVRPLLPEIIAVVSATGSAFTLGGICEPTAHEAVLRLAELAMRLLSQSVMGPGADVEDGYRELEVGDLQLVVGLVQILPAVELVEWEQCKAQLKREARLTAVARLNKAMTKQSEGEGEKPPGPGNADETETIDASGYVTNPKDPSAYVAATEALRKHTPAALATTYKQFRAILDRHPQIRRWQVRENRLSVHLADWTAYVQEETSTVDADGLLADQFEIEARKEEMRRRKNAGE